MDNKAISKLFDELIAECECDTRIESGIFDVYNSDHLVVLSEHMISRGISESIVEDAINSMSMEEGKYPERQAYNKEGWLVTFPSKEYRDAAIKKRTHFTSDPTHGKGGMNLYYKKRGKQKRQTSQSTTATQQQQDQQPSKKPTQDTQPEESPKAAADGSTDDTAQAGQQAPTPTGAAAEKDKSEPSTATDAAPSQAAGASQDDGEQSGNEPSSAGAPAINVPVVTPPPEQYASISKKFAATKRWTVMPYDEYHDMEGNLAAVVGLSGEVVPVKNTDREEYKIFAEKSMPS